MNVAAGIFLFVFGAFGVWWCLVRFPHAHFMRASSCFMSASGIVFLIWTATQQLVVGLSAVALLLVSSLCGAVGVVRKETRALPPG